jgi:hypothetical protein
MVMVSSQNNILKRATRLPPFPKVWEQRTDYGYCLREAFAAGEYQDKVYHYVMIDDWFGARECARRLMNIEEELERACGVNTTRPRYYLKKLMEAIERKDKRAVERLIGIHDTEILAALEVAKKP